MASLRQSPDPSDQNLAEILDKISSLDKKIEQLDRRTDSSLQPYDAENWISKDKTPVEIGGMKAELEEPVSPDDIDLLEGWIDMSAPEIRKQLLKQGIEIKDVMQD